MLSPPLLNVRSRVPRDPGPVFLVSVTAGFSEEVAAADLLCNCASGVLAGFRVVTSSWVCDVDAVLGGPDATKAAGLLDSSVNTSFRSIWADPWLSGGIELNCRGSGKARLLKRKVVARAVVSGPDHFRDLATRCVRVFGSGLLDLAP